MKKFNKVLDIITHIAITLGVINAAYCIHIGYVENFFLAIGSILLLVVGSHFRGK